jgi:hypothetical protein
MTARTRAFEHCHPATATRPPTVMIIATGPTATQPLPPSHYQPPPLPLPSTATRPNWYQNDRRKKLIPALPPSHCHPATHGHDHRRNLDDPPGTGERQQNERKHNANQQHHQQGLGGLIGDKSDFYSVNLLILLVN